MSVLRVEFVEGKGRVVRAVVNIAKGVILESVPAVRITAGDRPVVDTTALFNYYFVRPEERAAGPDYPGYVVFGLTSFCSHSDEPNAHVEWRKDNDGIWVDLTTNRAIAKGEEVTIHYANIDQYNVDGWIS